MSNKLFESNWRATKDALTEGLSGNRKTVTDIVFENTRKQMLSESATAGATQAGNIAVLNKVMLPLIRRVMPTLIANEIVGVQPMTGPVGQINTLRTRYANTKAGVTAGTEALSPFELANAYSGNMNVGPLAGGAQTAFLEGTAGNQLNIQIVKETVEAKLRRLSARWTMEATQDANASHGIDVEQETMKVLAQHIALEIDQELLGRISALVPVAGATYDQAVVTGTPTFVSDKHAALALLINQQANLIAARTSLGAANWAVVSTNALTVLQSATTSAFARTTIGEFEAPTNNKMVGVLNSAMKVYHNRYAPNDDVLIGLKGDNESTAGLFYCPWIPLQGVGPTLDPNTGEYVVFFMTRYGILELSNSANSLGNAADFYAKIAINSANLSFY